MSRQFSTLFSFVFAAIVVVLSAMVAIRLKALISWRVLKIGAAIALIVGAIAVLFLIGLISQNQQEQFYRQQTIDSVFLTNTAVDVGFGSEYRSAEDKGTATAKAKKSSFMELATPFP